LGSVVVAGKETHVVPAEHVAEVVDVTGAGDLYAAGFLFGLCRGMSLLESARLGTYAAAEIITHFGARPLQPLRGQAQRAGYCEAREFL
jgi:sugar/nucleoside kinase (ribokinase family)